MVKRISISENEFKISRPGFNVDAATSDQLAFDGFGGRYGGIFLKGNDTIDGTWSNETIVTPGNSFNQGVYFTTRRRKTISFGKTFSQPPQVIYMLRKTSAPNSGAYPRYSYIVDVTNGPIGSVFWASTTATSLIMRLDYPTYGAGSGITDFDVAYVVFQI